MIRGISASRYAEGVDAFLDGYGVSASVVNLHMAVLIAALESYRQQG